MKFLLISASSRKGYLSSLPFRDIINFSFLSASSYTFHGPHNVFPLREIPRENNYPCPLMDEVIKKRNKRFLPLSGITR